MAWENLYDKYEKALTARACADPAYAESSGDRDRLEIIEQTLEEYIKLLDNLMDFVKTL